MRLLIQRVLHACVTVEKKQVAQIQKGLLVFIGITHNDTPSQAQWLAQKLVQLRIFEDEQGKMNLSVQDVGGEILVVSQFTLYADAQKGNRPSFVQAARPEQAVPLYEYFVQQLNNYLPNRVQTGVFGAEMHIDLLNHGPVTIWLEK